MLPKLDIDADLALELLAPRHAEALFRLTHANRVHLRIWLPWLDQIRAVEDTRAFVALAMRQHAGNDGFQTVIVHAGEPVGMIGHHGIDWDRGTTSLGYWLAEAAQGHGFVTRACRAHMNHAFDALGLGTVNIRCAVGNQRSRAIPERLGFEIGPILPKAEWLYDHFVDHVVYTMRAARWRSASNARG
jgi:ribosomal-protein-serine acetyltransferase